MTDMLVKLYALPETLPVFPSLVAAEIKISKPIGSEKSLLVQWVRENFGGFWANEMEIAFSRLPMSCYIAQHGKEVIGFALAMMLRLWAILHLWACWKPSKGNR